MATTYNPIASKPLLEYGIVPAPNYYQAMSFLSNIPRVAETEKDKELLNMGRKIIKLARDDLDARPGSTGNLASTLQVKMQTEGIVIMAGGMMGRGTGESVYVDYAQFVEFGHKSRSGSMVPPHPFLYPAIEAVMNGTGGDGDGEPEGQKILRNIVTGARAASMAHAPVAIAETGMGLGGLLALSAVAMTAVSGIYAGISGGGF